MSAYGWIAAFVSCLAFGSFAVPIKGEVANHVNIDPLVMQSYKTGMCFLTCWSVVLLGEKITFTPWGFFSGLFWIPGGTAGIYAVRTAGLAVSQGMWSTLKIMVAFVWGIFVFQERVRNRWCASFAVMLMMMGLWGMSYFSSPQQQGAEDVGASHDEEMCTNTSHVDELEEPLLSDNEHEESQNPSMEPHACEPSNEEIVVEHENGGAPRLHKVSVRRLGFVCAAFDGGWGGSILVPMHFARHDAEGLGYIVSFAVGASTVLLCMWLARFLYHLVVTKSVPMSIESLPSFHLRVMWLPGGVAGLLWSVGNISSILAVQYLGEGVGYSIVQSQLLVAGLWGVFYFHEVQGHKTIAAWMLCGCVTVGGILLLSHEHLRNNLV